MCTSGEAPAQGHRVNQTMGELGLQETATLHTHLHVSTAHDPGTKSFIFVLLWCWQAVLVSQPTVRPRGLFIFHF